MKSKNYFWWIRLVHRTIRSSIVKFLQYQFADLKRSRQEEKNRMRKWKERTRKTPENSRRTEKIARWKEKTRSIPENFRTEESERTKKLMTKNMKGVTLFLPTSCFELSLVKASIGAETEITLTDSPSKI